MIPVVAIKYQKAVISLSITPAQSGGRSDFY